MKKSWKILRHTFWWEEFEFVVGLQANLHYPVYSFIRRNERPSRIASFLFLSKTETTKKWFVRKFSGAIRKKIITLVIKKLWLLSCSWKIYRIFFRDFSTVKCLFRKVMSLELCKRFEIGLKVLSWYRVLHSENRIFYQNQVAQSWDLLWCEAEESYYFLPHKNRHFMLIWKTIGFMKTLPNDCLIKKTRIKRTLLIVNDKNHSKLFPWLEECLIKEMRKLLKLESSTWLPWEVQRLPWVRRVWIFGVQKSTHLVSSSSPPYWKVTVAMPSILQNTQEEVSRRPHWRPVALRRRVGALDSQSIASG